MPSTSRSPLEQSLSRLHLLTLSTNARQCCHLQRHRLLEVNAWAMVQALLNKQPLRRPCCEQLRQHPFLAGDDPASVSEAKTGPSPASKASQDRAATSAGRKLAQEDAERKDAAAPGVAPGTGMDRSTRGQGKEQTSLAPSSARYAQHAYRMANAASLLDSHTRMLVNNCQVRAADMTPLHSLRNAVDWSACPTLSDVCIVQIWAEET